MFDRKLYVFGGLDIREGSLNSLYEISLTCLDELSEELQGDQQFESRHKWRYVQTTGSAIHVPGPIAYHTSIVYKDNMYLFGGNNPCIANDDGEYCKNIHYLNLRTMGWSISRTRGDEVRLRDEHTAVFDPDSVQMIVFGGFAGGTRSNDIAIYNFPSNTWTNVEISEDNDKPCPRSGHQAVVCKGNMYIFGGKDDSSQKLNDFWSFNIADQKWLQVTAGGEAPYERSGHSMSVFEDFIILFGGIWDVTKELNDLHVYHTNKNEWVSLQN